MTDKDYGSLDLYLEKHLGESIDELSNLVAQPSVSAQNWGLEDCAALVEKMLQKRGFQVKTVSTDGAPVVFGVLRGRSERTLLIYNHYDVQPAEPLELWETPPFEPSLREGKLFGRGVSDDKGQFTARLHAIDALLEVEGELPCTVKFLIEGEEETSSTHLHDFIRNHMNELKADACLWEFGGVDSREVPMQYLGLRGICYVELSVETAKTDSHSGVGGSIFPNAAWRLVWALNTLKGADERILIPGFYNAVKQPSDQDRELMEALPEISGEYREMYGVKEFLNGLTDGVELRIAEVFQPTCTICGLTSGYQGAGSKTVLPKSASAKVDFRLVPDQNPEQILQLLRKHLDAKGFSDVKISYLGGDSPARTAIDDPFVDLVVRTAEPVYGCRMQIVPMTGGSGPIYPFVHDLNLPVVSAGAGYPGTLAHAPNENLRIDLYLKHAKHVVRMLKEFAATND